MSVEQKTPEATPSLPPEVQEFQAAAEQMRADFTFELAYPMRTEEGIVDYDSLGAALDTISQAATEDPSVLSLVQAVNESNRATAETSKPQAYRKATERPEFGLLKLSGGVRKVEQQQQVAPSSLISEKEPVVPQRAKQLGHQILVDGHLVRGHIVPGRNEVQTPAGILRTRETPRLG